MGFTGFHFKKQKLKGESKTNTKINLALTLFLFTSYFISSRELFILSSWPWENPHGSKSKVTLPPSFLHANTGKQVGKKVPLLHR